MTITPVLLVDSVEASLPFWVDRLGWQQVAAVPEGDALAFVMLARDEASLMLQTYVSAQKDTPALVGERGAHRTSLFVKVDDWSDTVKRLEGYAITMPERETFYGMREIGIIEPGGHSVIFAADLDQPGT